jgi:hypothetical protein
MCLCANGPDTKKAKASLEAKGKLVKVYKRLKVDKSNYVLKLVAPYKYTEYKAGLHEFVENKNKVKVGAYRNIYKGFHCYLTSSKAIGNQQPGEIIVPFHVRPCDLIGAKGSHAVFSKAILFQEDYDEAMKKAKVIK